jgi:hypothetical protein
MLFSFKDQNTITLDEFQLKIDRVNDDVAVISCVGDNKGIRVRNISTGEDIKPRRGEYNITYFSDYEIYGIYGVLLFEIRNSRQSEITFFEWDRISQGYQKIIHK